MVGIRLGRYAVVVDMPQAGNDARWYVFEIERGHFGMTLATGAVSANGNAGASASDVMINALKSGASVARGMLDPSDEGRDGRAGQARWLR